MKPLFVISCPIDTYSGYGARGRDVAKAIIELDKYDVKILPQRWGATPWGFIEDHSEWEFLNKHLVFDNSQITQKPDIWMQITIPNEFQPLGHFNIGMTAGIETTLCKKEWIDGGNRMDIILGSSEHSLNVLKNTKYEQRDNKTQQVVKIVELTTPTEVLFEGLNLDIYKKTDSTFDLSNIKESFAFLFVGHWTGGGLGHDRKNIPALIKGFCESFKNQKSPPALILKTTTGIPSYIDRDRVLSMIQEIKKTVRGKCPNIYLLHGEFTDKEINDLYNHPKIKTMISLTRGEGFGRPLLEFTQTKKPIITTGWSGHTDFLKPNMSTLLPGKLIDLHPSSRNDWFVEGAKWFEVDIMALGKSLKEMFKKYNTFLHGAKKQGNYCKENFSYEKMKEKFKRILSQNFKEKPKQVGLNLPKLNKVSSSSPKLNLPKLAKSNQGSPKLKLPKLQKV